ncbi:MAG: hypothetical protein ACOC2J_03495, partial [bacterium]
EGMMSAQVLTYPFDVVKLTGITDNINLIYLSGHPGNNIDRSTDRSSDEDFTSMLENITESEEINSLSEGSTSIQGESTHKAEESKTVPVESITQEPKILPEQSTSTSEDSASIPEQSTSMLATRYAEGEFLGYVDQESVKIRFGGKNQLFFLTGRSREELKSFQVGERIGFDYLRNKEGQYILYSLNKDKQYVIGDFSRQLDRYSIEVIIEDGPVIFQLNDEAVYQLDKFQKGELVRIEYTQDQEGQMVANQLLKVPNE